MARNDEDYDFLAMVSMTIRAAHVVHRIDAHPGDTGRRFARYKSQQPNVDIVPQTCRCQRTASRRGIGHLGGS